MTSVEGNFEGKYERDLTPGEIVIKISLSWKKKKEGEKQSGIMGNPQIQPLVWWNLHHYTHVTALCNYRTEAKRQLACSISEIEKKSEVPVLPSLTVK